MTKKKILGSLLCAGSLAASLTLAGCSAAPGPGPTSPTATTTPPTEHNERPDPSAKQDSAVAGSSSESQDAAAPLKEESGEKRVAKPAKSLYHRGRESGWLKIKTAAGLATDAERKKWNER